MSDVRGCLQVLVHAARSLAPADFKLLKKPSSDPYCMVALGSKRFRTATVNENLNPVWEHAASMIVGTYLPHTILTLLGHQPGEPVDPEALPKLEFTVFDEDAISADEQLGYALMDLTEAYAKPEEWLQVELKLRPAQGFASGGTLLVSVCWEPASFFPPYVARMLSVICFAAAFAMFFLAAFCRWQRPGGDNGALLQPGVAATLLLAAVVMLLAAAVHFVMAHTLGHVHIDELAAAQSASHDLSDALATCDAVAAPAASESAPLIVINAKARGMMTYELGVSVADGIFTSLQLPLVIIAMLLPVGGFALGALAISLQLVQHFSLRIFPGPIFGMVGLGAAAVGIAIVASAENRPRAQHKKREESVKRQSMLTRKSTANFSETSSNYSTPVRRRDYLVQRVAGVFRSTPPTPEHS